MTITFVTTQEVTGSTVRGRIIPLAQQLKKYAHIVTILGHGPQVNIDNVQFASIGENPFRFTAAGKVRYRGSQLVIRLLRNTLQAASALIRSRPQVIVIVKPLPENVLAVRLARLFYRPEKTILDVDDFELSANVITSSLQRLAIHAAEKQAVSLVDSIVVATPFLADYMGALNKGRKGVTLLPTGLSLPNSTPSLTSSSARLVYAGSVSVSSGHRTDMLPAILVEIQKQIPEITLFIAGSGDDASELKHTFKKMGLENKVVWKDSFTVNDVGHMLFSRDVLIDPVDGSIVNRAKSTFRVMLALQMGLPIVTSNIGIRGQLIPRVFHERFFATAGNSGDYAAKIVSLVQTPLTTNEQAVLKNEAASYVWEKLAQTFNSLF